MSELNPAAIKRAVISLSGGLDSTCLLLKLLSEGKSVSAYSFYYGQKHKVELKKVKKNIKFLQEKGLPVTHQIIDLESAFAGNTSALVASTGEAIPHGYYAAENMKSTVVPLRNVIFSAIIYSKAINEAVKTGDNVEITLGLHAGDHCFTRDTKILTPDGYKTIDDLKIGDIIYSVNSDNQIVEDKVTNAWKVATVNNTLKIDTTSGSIHVTPDHKIYRVKFGEFDKSKGYTKSIELVKASDLNIGDILLTSRDIHSKHSNTTNDIKIDVSQFNDGNFSVTDDKVFYKQNYPCPRFIDAKYIVQLMAWYITEGWSSKQYIKNSKSSRYLSSFSQSLWMNMEDCDTIQKMFIESGIPVEYNYSKLLQNGYPKEVTYVMSGIISAMLQTAGSYADEKHIPNWLKNFLVNNPQYISEFVMNMIEGDGHYDELSGMYSYISKSHQLAEDLGFLIKKLGYAVKYSNNKRTNCIILMFGNLGRKSGLVQLGDLAQTKITNITSLEEEEDVFDITVENNHNFFAGEYGNIFVHNCIYPDCRPESQEACKKAFELSDENSDKVDYEAPFINIDKGQVLGEGLKAMKALGFTKAEIKKVLKNTHTCYDPNEKGESCGLCGSCQERILAFDANGMKDPAKYSGDYDKLLENARNNDREAHPEKYISGR